FAHDVLSRIPVLAAGAAGRARGKSIAAIAILVTAGILGCSAQSQEKPEKQAGKPPAAVEVARVAAADVVDGIDVVGSLAPKFGADVSSEYTGIVTEVLVTEWVNVKKGDILARLDTREIEVNLQKVKAEAEVSKANLLQAEVAENRAERENERSMKLKEEGLITQQNLDDARTEREAARARKEAARAQLKVAQENVQQVETRLSKSIIRAPMDGVVSLRNVNVGDFVGELGGKAMFRVVDNRRLDLTVTVPSLEMASVHVGQPLTFSTDALPGKTFRGKVMFINPTVNEADRSVKVVAEVDNASQELKGGLFVKGRILTGSRSGVLRIPRTALLTWDVASRKAEVFVVSADTAERRSIQTGGISGDQVEVTSGLSSGQMVISRGGFNVKDGEKVSVTRGGDK
ncbi:MAG TPA: efflux RND transporter periplasmic adaptor subunit, partial [Thermodesulfobacteriota bacterium]|nr:efflux RND transporter periplasmic adaptor subunit [Thermodesulfobacteriota bacterium]